MTTIDCGPAAELRGSVHISLPGGEPVEVVPCVSHSGVVIVASPVDTESQSPELDLNALMQQLDRSIEGHQERMKNIAKLRRIFGFSTSV